ARVLRAGAGGRPNPGRKARLLLLRDSRPGPRRAHARVSAGGVRGGVPHLRGPARARRRQGDRAQRAPGRDLHPVLLDGERAQPRIANQVRRFALLWAVATAGVIVALVATSVATAVYRSDAADRATAGDHAQAAATALLGSIQQEMNHRLAWQLSHDARDASA